MLFPMGSHIYIRKQSFLSKKPTKQFVEEYLSSQLIALAQQVANRFNVLHSSMQNQEKHGAGNPFVYTLLVWDTGVSHGIMLFQANFINSMETDIPFKNVIKVNQVIGIGTTLSKVMGTIGEEIILPCIYYHLPSLDVHLFIFQMYQQMHGWLSTVKRNTVNMTILLCQVQMPIETDGTNLPVLHDVLISQEKKKAIGFFLFEFIHG